MRKQDEQWNELLRISLFYLIAAQAVEAYVSFAEADSAFYVRYMLQFSLWDPALGRIQGLDKLAHPQQRKLSK